MPPPDIKGKSVGPPLLKLIVKISKDPLTLSEIIKSPFVKVIPPAITFLYISKI